MLLAAALIAGCSSSQPSGPSWSLTGGKDAVPPPAAGDNLPPEHAAPKPQLVQAPQPAIRPAARAAAAPARIPGTIEVQRGDTLLGLAARHRISIDRLMTFNKLGSARLAVGQRLALPPEAVTQAPTKG
jgi:hypothetical protein